MGGGCNGQCVLRINTVKAFADLCPHIRLHLRKAVNLTP